MYHVTLIGLIINEMFILLQTSVMNNVIDTYILLDR